MGDDVGSLQAFPPFFSKTFPHHSRSLSGGTLSSSHCVETIFPPSIPIISPQTSFFFKHWQNGVPISAFWKGVTGITAKQNSGLPLPAMFIARLWVWSGPERAPKNCSGSQLEDNFFFF